ncbi:CRAL-TRIO domain-containing protein [Dendryphion nanum]|uniref:CRAL-TRIO domain-containing protein n=1 Tax=Dendryphion nanum TaxID=256645 RepID=A0A9P9D7I2_9PLEO|nr:CRAL-TRIO domain-containing protein [Dendryphion nanum]
MSTSTPTTPRKTPFELPEPQCVPEPHQTLTSDQQTKYDEVLAAVKTWETLPTSSTSKTAEKTPLTPDEKLWLTRECLLRYLRATKWNVASATKRVQDTLIWRREYGVAGFTAEYISEENATGKQVLLGFDNDGRPCLYLLPNKQNTPNSPKQVQHLVYMLERTLDIAPPGQETLALLIDFRNSSAGSNPSVGTGRAVLSILQNHYPERLGRALITHLPWYVSAFLKMISPFIDPVTKTKIRYNEPLDDHIPPAQLMANAGGDVEFLYEHDVYWPAFNALADKRRAERKARWEKAGGLIGESEVYLWGGEEKSVGAKEEVAPVVNGDVKEQAGAGAVATGPVAGVEASLAKLDIKDEKKVYAEPANAGVVAGKEEVRPAAAA